MCNSWLIIQDGPNIYRGRGQEKEAFEVKVKT